jgi:hypothetical protein
MRHGPVRKIKIFYSERTVALVPQRPVNEDSVVAEKTVVYRMPGSGPGLGDRRP